MYLYGISAYACAEVREGCWVSCFVTLLYSFETGSLTELGYLELQAHKAVAAVFVGAEI